MRVRAVEEAQFSVGHLYAPISEISKFHFLDKPSKNIKVLAVAYQKRSCLGGLRRPLAAHVFCLVDKAVCVVIEEGIHQLTLEVQPLHAHFELIERRYSQYQVLE